MTTQIEFLHKQIKDKLKVRKEELHSFWQMNNVFISSLSCDDIDIVQTLNEYIETITTEINLINNMKDFFENKI